jgi:uncharacterized membrane protein YqjE
MALTEEQKRRLVGLALATCLAVIYAAVGIAVVYYLVPD